MGHLFLFLCLSHKFWLKISNFKYLVEGSGGFPGSSSGKESAYKVQEILVRFLGQEDLLEKGMATHSSILPGESPWTEEPGGLQSMGSQRVRHD